MRGTGAGNPALGRHFTTRKLGLLMCVAVLISVIFVDQGVAVAKKLRPTPVVSGTGYLNGICLDSLGNLFAVSEGLVRVLPKVSGSLYGVSVTKGVLTPLPIHGGFNCAVDSAGNLFVTNDQMSVPVLTVLPKSSGTVFGTPVTANEPVGLESNPNSGPAENLAFDSAGNLYIAWPTAGVEVLPKSNGTLFGVSVTANTVKPIFGAGGTFSIDHNGDLLGTSNIAFTGGPNRSVMKETS